MYLFKLLHSEPRLSSVTTGRTLFTLGFLYRPLCYANVLKAQCMGKSSQSSFVGPRTSSLYTQCRQRGYYAYLPALSPHQDPRAPQSPEISSQVVIIHVRIAAASPRPLGERVPRTNIPLRPGNPLHQSFFPSHEVYHTLGGIEY
jgi:hypothetical protein